MRKCSRRMIVCIGVDVDVERRQRCGHCLCRSSLLSFLISIWATKKNSFQLDCLVTQSMEMALPIEEPVESSRPRSFAKSEIVLGIVSIKIERMALHLHFNKSILHCIALPRSQILQSALSLSLSLLSLSIALIYRYVDGYAAGSAQKEKQTNFLHSFLCTAHYSTNKRKIDFDVLNNGLVL